MLSDFLLSTLKYSDCKCLAVPYPTGQQCSSIANFRFENQLEIQLLWKLKTIDKKLPHYLLFKGVLNIRLKPSHLPLVHISNKQLRFLQCLLMRLWKRILNSSESLKCISSSVGRNLRCTQSHGSYLIGSMWEGDSCIAGCTGWWP